MGNLKFFEDMVERKLLAMHTAYIASVISIDGNYAKIQPLGMPKQYQKNALTRTPLTKVPIASSAKFKFEKSKTINDTEPNDVAVIKPLEAGDIVICLCCERDITDAKRGINSTPSAGHHNMSDSLIVGVLS